MGEVSQLWFVKDINPDVSRDDCAWAHLSRGDLEGFSKSRELLKMKI